MAAERITYQKVPNCPGVSDLIESYYQQKDLSAGLCFRLGDWEVIAVSSDSHSWLDFKREGKVYSTERAVVYDVPIAQFPNLADGKMEVHINDEKLSGVVFRVVQGESKAGSYLYAVHLDEKGAFLCGKEKTNEKARARLGLVGECALLPEAIIK
jgi:hypothetical protein